MLKKRVTLAALAGTALLAAAPAFADGYRGDRHEFRGDRHEFRGDRHEFRGDRHQFWGDRHEFRGGQFRSRGYYANYPAPRYYGQRPVFVHRPVVVHEPVVVQRQPVVVYREHSSHDVLGGLIVGTVLGAVIANHAGY